MGSTHTSLHMSKPPDINCMSWLFRVSWHFLIAGTTYVSFKSRRVDYLASVDCGATFILPLACMRVRETSGDSYGLSDGINDVDLLLRQRTDPGLSHHTGCVLVDGAEDVNPHQPSDLTAPLHHGTLNQLFARMWGLSGLLFTRLSPVVHRIQSFCEMLFGPAVNQPWRGTSAVCQCFC